MCIFVKGTLAGAAGGSLFRILCVFFQICLGVSFFRWKIFSFPKVQNVLKPTVTVIKCVTGANVSAHYS